MSVDRRRFIKTVLLTSSATFLSWREVLAARSAPRVRAGFQQFGSAHAYLQGEKPLPAPRTTESTDVVVVGGGTAGIAAACHLRKAGKELLVLESEPHLGGTMLTPSPSWKGISYPLGSTYFARYDGVYREFLADIGVHPIETGEDALWFRNAGAVADWWNPKTIGTLPIPADEREGFRTFRDFLLALPLPTYPLVNAPQDLLAQYDALPARTFVERFRSRTLTSTMDLYARSVLGAPLAGVTTYAFLNFYSVEFGDAFGIPCYTFPGGLGTIARAAETLLGPERIRANALVLRVVNTTTGVEVTYVDAATGEAHLVRARKAVIATTKQVAGRLVPDLPAEQAKAMRELTYAPYVTVALCCNDLLFPARAFDFWVNDERGRFTDIIDVTASEDVLNKGFTRTGAFVYMLSSPRRVGSFAAMDEAAFERYLVTFAQEIARAVDENVPGAMDKIEELHVFGWGHSIVVPTTGSYGRLAAMISHPHGNMHFAHSDNDIAPGWENAVWHGADAARRVVE